MFHTIIGMTTTAATSAARPGPRAGQPAAEIAARDKAEQDAEAEEQVGQLGGDAEAGEEADGEPPRAAPGDDDVGERQIASAQNITAGASGVADMPPTPTRSVALIHSAARSAVARSNSVRPVK